MDRVGNQRQRAGEKAADRFDDGENGRDHQCPEQARFVAAVMMVVVMAVTMTMTMTMMVPVMMAVRLAAGLRRRGVGMSFVIVIVIM